MRKKVLVVCMLNSIHSAKWLAQFKDSEIDFFIFPSTYFRKLHPAIESLIKHESSASYKIQYLPGIAGWIDYIQERLLKSVLSYFSRLQRLSRYKYKIGPEILHALEFQSAAYLCSDFIESYGKDFSFIATNWGSDIFHYMEIPNHNTKIRKVLALADKYSSECTRDVTLATELGFRGEFLPVIPNAGGFALEEILKTRSLAASRKLLLVKGYGGYFGRVQHVIRALFSLMDEYPEYSVFFYSVTNDVINEVKVLQKKLGSRVSYSTVKNPLNHQELQEKFLSARIYIGCSISDGISTSFLESLVSGAYPIQTNTSCANEWISKGAVASLVNLDTEEIAKEIRTALENDYLVNTAQERNLEVSKLHLDEMGIKIKAETFY